MPLNQIIRIHGIPKSGSIVAAHLQSADPRLIVVYDPKEADCFVDDIVDTGRTQQLYFDRYQKKTYALFGKGAAQNCIRNVPPTQWVEFPWESQEQTNKEHQDFVVRLLEELGEDASRPALLDTPARFLKAWREMTRGYTMDVKLKAMEIEESLFPTDTHGMIVVRDIEFHSLCEHHLLPFVGKVHVGYLPYKHTIGHSKIPRIVEMYASRLQVQERLGQQICDAIADVVQPKGIGVLIEGSHFCMLMRGVKKEHTTITTSHLKGVFAEDARTRQEFLQLVRN
ncbi:GTP cyclohydrolase I FolE [Candidatus Peregrinibacteria bacterium CG22_combo_CG10-13_8_21_14_all_49_11]|nr:MAG: GTP cyclohydrolase I FolE [Candidatus Peregrinibacteria bacterium CG22_combo_CG10-13_8_21_14_all_49_11]